MRTAGEPDEVDHLIGSRCDWYPDSYPCPHYGCGGRMHFTESLESESLAKLHVVDLNPKEVFAALHGLGLPEERDCGKTAVLELMLGRRVVSVEATQIRGENRTVLHSIEFEDGRRLYLAAGTDGPTAYRLSTPHRYVEEALRDV